MAKISRYKPILVRGLNHLAGQNTLVLPYKLGDVQADFDTSPNINLLLVNGGKYTLVDDTDTFTVSFNPGDITITWRSELYRVGDIDDLVFCFNLFAQFSVGGGAPAASPFITVSSDATLTNERYLIVDTTKGLTLTDNGANASIQIGLNTGSGPNQIPQLDSSGRLPAADASLLINNYGICGAPQTITGNGATTVWTITDYPSTANALLVVLNGVIQTPGVHYTLAGNAMTISPAIANGDTCYVRRIGK